MKRVDRNPIFVASVTSHKHSFILYIFIGLLSACKCVKLGHDILTPVYMCVCVCEGGVGVDVDYN